MSYELLEAAVEDLRALTPDADRRILEKRDWFSASFENRRLEALAGAKAGQYKVRVGDYRVIYEIDRQKSMLVVLAVGHRSDIYR